MTSVTYLILRFAIVQNKFQQTIKNKISHINENHIKFEVSLHFLGIWPTVPRDVTKLMFNFAPSAKALQHFFCSFTFFVSNHIVISVNVRYFLLQKKIIKYLCKYVIVIGPYRKVSFWEEEMQLIYRIASYF